MPAAAPRSRYATFAENTTTRSIAWALIVTTALVVVVAMVMFGVGNDPKREIPETSRLDVAASAERAQGLAPFRVAVPALGEDWEAREARFADGQDPRWRIRYTAPSGSAVTMIQAPAITPGLLQDTLAGARTDGSVQVGQTQCETYLGGPAGDDGGAASQGAGAPRAVACTADGSAVLVSGTTDQQELVALADAALTSIRG
ncbi:DUF4245 domain-containing protein [Brachybacterium huguangmaarense]